MNKKRIGIFIALLAMVCMGLRAQSATSLRINEVWSSTTRTIRMTTDCTMRG